MEYAHMCPLELYDYVEQAEPDQPFLQSAGIGNVD